MTWRVAESLDVLLKEINARSPKRSKVSDGSIGDAAHASRDSDHNPWVKDGKVGVVTARDFTNDPGDGFDSSEFADWLRKRCRSGVERRVKYVISDRRIASDRDGWAWRAYTGTNPHEHHVHVSVESGKALYDSKASWGWEAAGKPPAKPAPPKEDDMASASEIAIEVAGRVPTTEEIAAAVLAALRTKPIAVNKPSLSEIAAAAAAGKPAPVGTEAPLAWFVQNIEGDGDNQAAAILAELGELTTAVRDLIAVVESRLPTT